MKRGFLAVALLFAIAAQASALSIAHDESVDGDLSDDNLNPTFVSLFPQESKILGSTTSSPIDRDFLTFTVPDGQVLDQIIWGLYDSTEDRSFFAIAEGDQIGSISNEDLLLGTALVGAPDVATNVLDDLGNASLGGTGFSGSLGPGQYTLWFQENAADTNYGYTIILSNAIPEPTMAIIPAIVGLVTLARRRRMGA